MHMQMVMYLFKNGIIIILIAGTSPIMQNRNAITAAVVSLIIVFILSSSLFFIGCVSGWFGHKHRQLAKINGSDKDISTQPTPVYKDLQPKSILEDKEGAFELNENVAYGPVRST